MHGSKNLTDLYANLWLSVLHRAVPEESSDSSLTAWP